MAAATVTATKTADSYIGSLICLVSKSDIRYEGFLFHLDSHDSTIGLRNVKSFGTEGRRTDGPQVFPSDKIYEFIFFRGSDIKDLQVISSPPPQSTSAVPDDPAIIRSHFPQPIPTAMASTSPGAATVANVSTSAQPILPVTPFQLNQAHDPLTSGSSLPGSSLPPPPVNISRPAVPNYWPTLIGSSGGVSHFQQHRFPPPPQSLVASLPPVQQQVQYQNVNASAAGGSNTSAAGVSSFSGHHHPLLLTGTTSSPNTLPPLLPTPSVQSNPGQFTKLVSHLSSIPMPNNGSSALSSVAAHPGPKMASPLPEVLNATPPPVTNEPSSVDLTISQTVTSSVETTGVSFSKQSKLSPMTIEEQSGLKQSSSSQSLQTTHIDAKTAQASVVEPLPSDSTEKTMGSLPKSTTKTLHGSTSSHHYKGQFAPGRDQAHRDPASTNHSYRGRARGRGYAANGVALSIHQSSRNQAVGRGNEFHLNGVPLRNHGDAGSHFRGRGAKNSRFKTRFKEDFDFEAMNEKFNKEEVWDLLGKNNKAESDDGNEDDKEMDGVKGEAREVHVRDDSKPVYCKDDFFDSLSCDALDHDSGKVKLSEQRKKDAETFGEIPKPQRSHGQGPRWAGASQGSYRGRGHGTTRGGRGRGRAVWGRVS
ncbi:protein decapping 5-like isoform X1 [Nicotiana tomentosiformis]|uniref:protein decapping 5-like isoform X1 n=1 Tax=Nicotiana tomentosiformis TaxID=4098 RepID=UPI00051C2BD1|nr:protein decapping 5-like isoform X2 [Nicotiana tomentosiformis]